MNCDLLVVSAAQLLTAPPGDRPLLGPDLDRPQLLEDAAVACAGGVIAAVGSTADVTRRYPEKEAARVLDARGLLVAPGFVDSHTHLPFAGSRAMEFEARARGESYAAIAERGGGIRASVRHLRDVSEETLSDSVVQRLGRLLEQGTTTVEAKSGYGLKLEEELKQLRALRRASERSPVEIVPTFLGAHEVPDEHRADRETYVLALIESMIPAVAKEKLARFCAPTRWPTSGRRLWRPSLGPSRPTTFSTPRRRGSARWPRRASSRCSFPAPPSRWVCRTLGRA